MLGIAHEPVTVPVGEARRLRLQVETLGAERIERREVETGQDVQHQQRDDALAVGRALVDVQVAVSGADRRHVVGARGGEVVHRVQAAGRLQRSRHVGGDGPGVKGLAAAFGDGAQRIGERRLAVDFAGGERASPGQEYRPRMRVRGELAGLARPHVGDHLVNRISVARVGDGGRERGAEPQPPVIAREQIPRRHGARNGDGVGGLETDLGDTLCAKALGGRRSGSASRAVEGDRRAAAAGRRIECENVAADSGRMGFDHRQHRGGGDGAVDRVAAGAQHVERGLGCRRVR